MAFFLYFTLDFRFFKLKTIIKKLRNKDFELCQIVIMLILIINILILL